MSASVRSIDLVARYGGEEFAIMLLHVDVRLAQAVAERVRTFVERQVVAVAQGKTIPVTVSIGVALFPHDAGDSQSLIAAADSALYRAKQQGRNCVSLYSVPAEADTTETARGTLLGRTDVGPLESLALALEAKDHFTHGHSEAVTNYSLAIADALSLPQDCLEALRAASLLHDIGKVGIPDSVLNKPGPLTSEERKLVQAHTINGERVLRSLPRLDDVLPAVLHHHERYDGAGYPAGLAGADIPLLARILAVADAFEAMTADRPYRSRLSREAAIAELRRGAGKQFDPEIVEAFLKGEVRSAVPSSAEPGAAEAQQGLGRMVPEV